MSGINGTALRPFHCFARAWCLLINSQLPFAAGS
jgi:hypothetical protein